jgi:predicted phage terminase large subunit-like protein
MANPDEALDELERLDAEESLLNFIRLMWSVIEPGRQFVYGWAVEAICEHLTAVSKGQIRKLLINVPPGCMKSLTTCVFWPAWEWGPFNRPDLRYVCASYSADLTIRDNRRCRQLMQSEVYQRLWGDRFKFATDQDAKVKFENDKRGFKIATSVGGAVVGERGDRFIVDDPHNIKEAESDTVRDAALQWFTEIVPTRTTDPDKAAFIVIMQRVHDRDVSGLIIAEDMGYEVLCLPMEYEADHPTTKKYSFSSIGFKDPRKEEGELLWKERFSAKVVEELKTSLRAWGGSYAEAGQLQQRPAPRGGGMFKKSYFQVVPSMARMSASLLNRVRAWDLAGSEGRRSAYTVGCLISRWQLQNLRKVVCIEDIVRKRLEPHGVDKLIIDTAESDGRRVRISLPQDPGQAGKAQKSHIAQLLEGFDVHFSPESGSKEDRAAPLAAQGGAGNLYLIEADWNEAFIKEALVFPAGEFKDQIDASSRGYHELLKKRALNAPIGVEIITPGNGIPGKTMDLDEFLPEALRNEEKESDSVDNLFDFTNGGA